MHGTFLRAISKSARIFDAPTPIPYSGVTRHVWGDAGSGFVDDWIYVSSMQIHQLLFGIPPGGAFRHSPEYRTVFNADETLTVLKGTMILTNPETGEVVPVQTGETAFFRRDTWHHAFAWGTEELRVLEYFAPPPATGSSGAYARLRPYLEQSRYDRPELVGSFTGNIPPGTIKVLREADRLWSLDAEDERVMIGLYVSTDHLTSGTVRLAPGARSSVRSHRGSVGLYVQAGRVNILIEDTDVLPRWFELHPDDGFFLPEGARYRLCNMGGEEAEVIFGCAPDYRTPELQQTGP
jgi:mannose-6-phosphate isomerase-like protein (cupin superfamily)